MTTGLHPGNGFLLNKQMLEKNPAADRHRSGRRTGKELSGCQLVESNLHTRFSEMLYAFALDVSVTSSTCIGGISRKAIDGFVSVRRTTHHCHTHEHHTGSLAGEVLHGLRG